MTEADPISGLTPRWQAIPGWKRGLLGLSAVLGLSGFGASGYEGWQKPETEAPARHRAAGEEATAFEDRPALVHRPQASRWGGAPEAPGAGLESEAQAKPTWSGAVGRLGGGFFLAMMVGILLRWFVKTVISVICLAGVVVAALTHYGLIEPFWSADTTFVKAATLWVMEQTESVVAFIKGYLPSTAGSAAGFFLGFRR